VKCWGVAKANETVEKLGHMPSFFRLVMP